MTPITDDASILIIDDDALTRALAVEALREAGFNVVEAESGEAGLAAFEAHRLDLVLLDVVMPGLDGFEVCRRIRTHPRLSHVPVIMLTGLEDTESIEKAYDSGATDFISKPIHWALLRNRIGYAMRAAGALDELIRSERNLSSAQEIAHMGRWEEALAGARQGCGYRLEYRIVRPDGFIRTVSEEAVAINDPDGSPVEVQGTLQDVTERVEAEKRIRYLAFYDDLTGLPNRAYFREMVHAALLRAGRRRSRCAVVLVDVVRFGRVTQSLGQESGDQALQLIAARLREFQRSVFRS